MKREIPDEIKNAIINISGLENPEPDDQVTNAATVEAMMTFLKVQNKEEAAGRVYVNPGSVQTRDELFHFARVFQAVLTKLQNGEMQVSPQIKDAFADRGLDALLLLRTRLTA